MFENDLSLYDEKTIDVKVYTHTDEFVGDAELRIARNHFPTITFNIFTDIRPYKSDSYFRCDAKDTTYSLLECEVDEHLIVPKLILKGKKKENVFSRISLVIDGVSEWMNRHGRFEVDANVLIRDMNEDIFNVEITDDRGDQLLISCDHEWATKQENDNTYRLSIHTILSCEKKNGVWTATDVINMAHQFKRFFTLLLGFPLGIKHVFDSSGEEIHQSVYFSHPTEKKHRDLKPINCFVSSSYLFSNDKWAILFTHYFNKNAYEFNNIWSRLIGVFYYKGFWEYDILAHVSLLDNYVSRHVTKTDGSIPEKMLSNLRKKMRAVIEECQLEHAISNVAPKKNYDAVFGSLTRQINQVKNTQFASFSEKFDFTMRGLNTTIKEIIGFSIDDFNSLKRLRDFIAHGDNPPTVTDSDITLEMSIRCKLKLLLMYWAYQDLGFSDQEFIHFLDNAFYPVTRQANLNTHIIDKTLNNYFYLGVDEADFNHIRNTRYFCMVLNYIEEHDEYRLELDATKKLDDWLINSQPDKKRSVQEELMSIVDVSNVKNIAYVGIAYICSGELEYKVNSSICILNCPDVVRLDDYVNDHLHVYDDVSQQWQPSKFDMKLQKGRRA